MAKNTTINIRVNSEVRDEAGVILDSMGLSFSDAFNLLLHQIKLQRSLPFEVVAYSHVPKAETLALIERIEKGEEELIGPFDTIDDLIASLDNEVE